MKIGLLIGYIIILIIVVSINVYMKNWDFFKVNLYEIFTISIGFYISYFFTKSESRKNKITNKVEVYINDIQELIKLDKIGHANIEKTLTNMKLVRKKINFVKMASKNITNISDDIEYIEQQFNAYSDNIASLNKPLKKYTDQECSEIQNYLTNIEIRLDDINMKLYGIKN